MDLTNFNFHDIISHVANGNRKNGGVAQLARAIGSYPIGHGFKSNLRYHMARWSSG